MFSSLGRLSVLGGRNARRNQLHMVDDWADLAICAQGINSPDRPNMNLDNHITNEGDLIWDQQASVCIASITAINSALRQA